MNLDTYRAKLSPREYQILRLIQEMPHASRAELAAQLYPNEPDGINIVGSLTYRLRQNLKILGAPFLIRSKQWRGYWIEWTEERRRLTVKEVIALGLRDHYHNSEFCAKLADNVLASLEEASLPTAALEGLLAGTHEIVRKKQPRDDTEAWDGGRLG